MDIIAKVSIALIALAAGVYVLALLAAAIDDDRRGN